MNFLVSLFSSSYEELWKAIIRPYRDEYTGKDLGPERFRLNQKYYKRTDFSLMNSRNIRLMCSYWEPYDEEREFPRLPCVVYLHGNSSSRCEALSNLKYLLPLNITVFAFDFAGCGRSEGEYISLGWYETLDVQCIINFLRKSNKVSAIGLWGRSMGAVTSIIYASKDQSIGGIFLDSPFYSLNLLIDELSSEKVSLPNFLVKRVVKMLKETVKEKGQFNIDDIEPVKFAKKCFVPAFFSHGKDDTFVNMHHCKDLYNVYPGEKNILFIDGDHNSLRPNKLNEKAAEFFYNALKCKYIRELNDYYNGYRLIFNDWENSSLRTPTGDKETKIKIKNMNYRNYGDTVPVGDIEEPIIKKKIIKKIDSNYLENPHKNSKKKEKYRFRIYKNNKSNSNDNKINDDEERNNNKIIKKNSSKYYKEKSNYKKSKKSSLYKYPSSSKEIYDFKTFSKEEGKKNNLTTSESNFTKYNIATRENMVINTQNINNYNKQYHRHNENHIYNNNQSDYFYYNANNYKTNTVEGEMPIKRIQMKQHSQNKVMKPYTPCQQKIKYIYPSPTLVNQSDIIANSNSSFKNNKSVSPSYMMNNNNNRKENYSIYDIDNNNLSNELYYSGNNISINNYNLYRYQINTTNYSQNY